MAIRESVIETYLKKQVRKYHGETRKLRWIGRRSAPDRFVMLNGETAFVEVKRPGEEPTAAQHRELLRLAERGVLVAWVNCEDHVDDLIRMMRHKGPRQ